MILDRTLFKIIIACLYIKLLFSYLQVELTFFQSNLISNFERFNFFNFPQNFSNYVEVVLLPILVGFLFLYSRHYKKTVVLFLMFSLGLILNGITAILSNSTLYDSINYNLKLFSPILFYCSLMIYAENNYMSLKKTFLKIAFFCLGLSCLALLFFNPSQNRLVDYLPIYFSGIHTHSYILVYLFVGISFIISKKYNLNYLIAFFTITLAFLFFGYNVRTSIIVYLIYIFTSIYLKSNISTKAFFIQVLFFTITAGIIFAFVFFEFSIVNDFSSGRLTMYKEKMNLIYQNTTIEFLFGRGPGSDLITTEEWWWAAKGSHSDIITYLIENGVLYYIVFLSTIFLLAYKKIKIITGALIFGAVISSTISNGVFTRPIVGYVFFLTIALINNYED